MQQSLLPNGVLTEADLKTQLSRRSLPAVPKVFFVFFFSLLSFFMVGLFSSIVHRDKKLAQDNTTIASSTDKSLAVVQVSWRTRPGASAAAARSRSFDSCASRKRCVSSQKEYSTASSADGDLFVNRVAAHG